MKRILQLVSDDFEDYWENGAYPMGDFYECLLAKEFGWLNSSYYGISYSADAEEFHTMCMNLQNYYNSVQSKNESISDEMKILFEQYGKDFEVDILAIKGYELTLFSVSMANSEKLAKGKWFEAVYRTEGAV